MSVCRGKSPRSMPLSLIRADSSLLLQKE
ncbi:MAG: hypothetical protein JWO42_3335, partial [Chloroflexi bacterium]|nr:hypothetical protein [Chloroflexota bacterium]